MAKRINTKFVAIAGSCVLALSAGAFLLHRVMNKPHPEFFKAQAQEAESHKNWQSAIDNWNKAVAAAPNNPELLTDRGILLHQLARFVDPTINERTLDRNDWEQALAVNPNYIPAVVQLRNYWEEVVHRQPGSAATALVARKWSKEALRLAPDNPDAPKWEAFLDSIIIDGWVRGHETDENLVKDTEENTRALMSKHPELPELPAALANLDIHRGQLAAAAAGPGRQPAIVTAYYNQAMNQFQKALATQPDNAMLHFDAARVYLVLSQFDHATATSQMDHLAASTVERKKAMAVLKPDDPDYTDVALGCAAMIDPVKNPDEARDILSTLLRSRNFDPSTVVEATPLIQMFPDLRPQSIASLESAYTQGPNTKSLTPARFTILLSLVQLQLADLQNAEAAASPQALQAAPATQPADNAAKLAQLRKILPPRLALLAGTNFNTLLVSQCQAQYDLTEKDYIGAIELLTRVRATNKQLHDDWRLNWFLTLAFYNANERQQARESCEYTLAQNPGLMQAHKLLVQLLTSEGTEAARQKLEQEVNFLRRIAPDDPDVIALQLAAKNPVQSGAAAMANNTLPDAQSEDLYNKLPEDTPPQLIRKAAIAVQTMKKPDDAIRLLKRSLELTPGDVPTIEFLVDVYGLKADSTSAMAVVEAQIQLQPKNQTLKYILEQLQHASPKELQHIQEQIAAQSSNISPYIRAETDALAQDNFAEAERQLKDAEKVDPNNKELWDRFFRLYAQTKQWNKIDPYLKKLADSNYDQAHGLLYNFQLAKAKADAPAQMSISKQLMTNLPEFAMSYYCMAQACQASGLYDQAVFNYDTAMAKKGVARDAAVMLVSEIHCFDEMKNPQRAMLAIAEGLRKYPDDPAFLNEKIHHEMNNGDHKAAAADLEKYIADHPSLPDAYLDLAAAKMRITEDDLKAADTNAAKDSALSARDLMKQALDKFPDDARVYNRLSEILRFGGDMAGAEKILLTLADRPTWKKEADPQEMLGRFYATTGQLDKAEDRYSKALSLATDLNRTAIRSRYAEVLTQEKKYDQALAVLAAAGDNDNQILRQRINILVNAGRYAQAEQTIQQMLAAKSGDAATLQTGWAQLEMTLGKKDSAVEHIALALAADPKCVAALTARAKLKLLQTPPDLDGALGDLNTARLLNPDDVDLLMTLADAQMAKNNAKEAERALQAALRQSPGDFGIRFRLAYTLANYPPADLDGALEVLQEGRAQIGGDRNPDLSNNIAAVYEQKGDLASAIKTVADALEQMHGNETLIHSYLRLLLSARQFQPALDAANTVLNSKPDVWWALEYRGRARANLGDKKGALDDLTKAFHLADKDHDIAASTGAIGVIADEIDGPTAINLIKDRAATDPTWQVTLVLLYHRQGQDAAAIPLIDGLLKGQQDMPINKRLARLELAGMVYTDAMPKPFADKAYQTYKQILALSPDNVSALNNFACLCADGFKPPKTQEGLTAVKHAIDVLSSRGATDSLVDDTYGWLMIQSGQTMDGMDVVRKALSRQTFPEGYYHLGEGYLRLNRPTDAQQQVSLALDEIAKAQQENRPVSPAFRAKVENLSNRVIDMLRVRTSSLP